MEIVTAEALTKSYGRGELILPVLKGVTFGIRRGEYVALMGSSGSGKSTLMNILGCLDRPTTGKYLLDGHDVGALSADDRAELRNSKIGFVFQSFNLLRRTTALENVIMPLTYAQHEVAEREAVARGMQLLERVGLGERLKHEPSELSGGQQQRVAIARALVNRPVLLLADEPTGNLDSKTTGEILTMFRELNKQEGLTILIVTHEPDVAEQADRIIRMQDGLIVEPSQEQRP